MIPTLVILGGEMFCNDTEDLNESVCMTDIPRYVVLAIFSFIVIFLIVCMVVLSSVYNQRTGMKKSDYLARNSQFFELNFSLYIICVILIESIAYKRLSYDVYKAKCIINSLLSLLVYIETTRSFTFRKFEVQKLFLTLMGLVMAFDLSTLIPQHFDAKEHYFPVWFIVLGLISVKVSQNLICVTSVRNIKLDPQQITGNYRLFGLMFPVNYFSKIVSNSDYSSNKDQESDKNDTQNENQRKRNIEIMDENDKDILP
jgi:hypothetical protein